MTQRYFDAYEIEHVVEYTEGFCEPLHDRNIEAEREAFNYKADFWTLYGHVTGEGVIAIGDFESEDAAEEVLHLIESRPASSLAGDQVFRDLLTALEQAVAALNTAPRFKVRSLNTDSYEIAARCDRAVAKAKPAAT